jgi:hypothetical protein
VCEIDVQAFLTIRPKVILGRGPRVGSWQVLQCKCCYKVLVFFITSPNEFRWVWFSLCQCLIVRTLWCQLCDKFSQAFCEWGQRGRPGNAAMIFSGWSAPHASTPGCAPLKLFPTLCMSCVRIMFTWLKLACDYVQCSPCMHDVPVYRWAEWYVFCRGDMHVNAQARPSQRW